MTNRKSTKHAKKVGLLCLDPLCEFRCGKFSDF